MICNLPPVAILLPTTLHAHVVAKCAATAPQPPPPPHIHPVKLPPPHIHTPRCVPSKGIDHRRIVRAAATTCAALPTTSSPSLFAPPLSPHPVHPTPPHPVYAPPHPVHPTPFTLYMTRPSMRFMSRYPNARLSMTSGGPSSSLSASTQQWPAGMRSCAASSSEVSMMWFSRAATRRTYGGVEVKAASGEGPRGGLAVRLGVP